MRPVILRIFRALRLGMLTLLLCLACAIVQGNETDSRRCTGSNLELQQAVLDVHEKQRNVGVAVLVNRNGKTAFDDYIGLADIEHNVPVTPDTRFGIASITKLITAIVVLKYAAENIVDLDASVQQYLADFPQKPEGEITLRMLLTHRSGIPHPRDIRTPKLYSTHYNTAIEALEVFADVPLSFVPGSESAYSSSNYNLLAAIIEKVAGRPFTDVVQRTVFDVLDMDDTTFDNVLRILKHRTRRYSFYRPWTYEESDELFVTPYWDYSFNTGGGNIISTATDMGRLAAALMAPGLLELDDWHYLYSDELFGGTDDEGQRFIYASGANMGLQAGLAIVPGLNTSSIVLSNTWGIGSRSAEITQLSRKLIAICTTN